MTQEITVVPVDARRSDWYRLVATVLNRLQNTTMAAGISATWGSVTGTLSDQSDLQGALDVKQATLVSGTNIKTVNGSSLLGSGNLAVGTVTSVGLSVPTGLTIAGSPISSSGTLALSFTAGYSIPTDAAQANWNTAYGWGNHASAGYLTTAAAASAYQPLDVQLTSLAALSYSGNANKVIRVNAGGTDFELASVSGGSLSDGDYGDITVGGGGTTLTIDNDAVTYAKMQNVSAASKLLGRGSAAGSGDTQEIALGTNLSMSGTTLNASAGVTVIETKVFVGGETSFSFSSIPPGFARLQLEVWGRVQNFSGQAFLNIRFNNDSSALYNYQRSYTNGTTTSGDSNLGKTGFVTDASNNNPLLALPGTGFPSGQPGGLLLDIFGYSNTALNTAISGHGINYGNSTSTHNQYVLNFSGQYRSTAAITSIDIPTMLSSAQMLAGSYAILRGYS